MIALAKKRMTAEEFIERHGDDTDIELVDGEIRRLDMPSMDHGGICNLIAYYLTAFVMQHKLGRIITNDSFIRTRSRSVRGADICYVSYNRYPANERLPNVGTAPIELVVETRSPSDSKNEMVAKANEYLEAGVQVVMLVDPSDSSATVLRLNSEPQHFKVDEELTLPDILPGFSVKVSEFFA